MIIAYWKLVLLTLALTELVKDDLVKDRRALPWVAIAISVVASLIYAGFNTQEAAPALVRGLTAGLITTGMYKLVKDYVRAILRA